MIIDDAAHQNVIPHLWIIEAERANKSILEPQEQVCTTVLLHHDSSFDDSHPPPLPTHLEQL